MMRRTWYGCVGLAVMLCAAASSLAGQAIGTPEYYLRAGQEALAAKSYSMAAISFRQASMLRPESAEFQFLLGTALASDRRWDDAREAFTKAVNLDPALKARVDAWLAQAPTAQPVTGAPRPPAAPEVPAAPATAVPGPAAPRGGRTAAFAVGDRVEVEYRTGEWFPGVVTAADAGACPYYRVRADPYGKGTPSNLGYGCSSVRAPTGIAQPTAACGGSNPNCPPTSAPPLGTYLCSEQIWRGTGAVPQYQDKYHGPITLLRGGQYRMFDGGAVGQYRYDATTHRIRWIGAGMAARGGVATFGLDGATPEITIVFETAYTRRTGNSAPRWQCGLSR
jgi:hypothetical protein